LEEPERSAHQKLTQRWLDALDKWYDTPAQVCGAIRLLVDRWTGCKAIRAEVGDMLNVPSGSAPWTTTCGRGCANCAKQLSALDKLSDAVAEVRKPVIL